MCGDVGESRISKSNLRKMARGLTLKSWVILPRGSSRYPTLKLNILHEVNRKKYGYKRLLPFAIAYVFEILGIQFELAKLFHGGGGEAPMVSFSPQPRFNVRRLVPIFTSSS